MLVKIIKARIIEKRRDELVSDMKESLIAYKRSGVHFGAVYDLMRDLIEDLRD